MATLLLLDTVSWARSHSETATCASFLSSVSRPESQSFCASSSSPCCCGRNCNKLPHRTTIRCATSEELLERLDPQLPRLPTQKFNKETVKRSQATNLQLDTRLNLNDSFYTLDVVNGERTQPRISQQPPSPGSNKDISKPTASFIEGQELDFKRRYNQSPYYLSLSQSSRRTMRNGETIQLVTRPLQIKQLNGAPSLYMGFATIILGVTVVLQKSGLISNGSDTKKKICNTCNGYGIRRCELCKGRGEVTWEGKLTHIDPCPVCFGARTIKCKDCGGVRLKKATLVLSQTKAVSKVGMKLPF